MTETSFNSFSGYRQTVLDIRDDLSKLKDYSEELELESNAASIEEVLQRSKDDSFDVAVIGEFKRGKSTIINALLEQDVLPTDAMPATATLNRVTYSITPFAKIEYKDGTTEEIPIEHLADYVTKLTDESEARAATIKQATVCYPTSYCKNNVDIIDTPGLNDDSAMADVTLSVIPQIDAALFVIMAQSPFSEYERDFLENKMISSDIGRIMFVVTGIDRLDEDDVERVLESIAQRINRYVIGKAKKVYGEDSPEFEAYKQKLGNIRVFGLSAKQALKGKLKDDPALLAESRFPEFEQELERFLTEDRGAIMLQVQVNKIVSAAEEIVKNVQLRVNALQMDKVEFDRKYSEAKEKIEVIRTERAEEFDRINSSAHMAYESVKPLVDEFWSEVNAAAMDVIDDISISKEDLGKDRIGVTQEKIMKKVSKAAEDKSRLMSEKIQNSITRSLGNEAERLAGFEMNFFNSVQVIQNSFIPSAAAAGGGVSTDKDQLMHTIIGSGISIFTGLGGAYTGFREFGVKGALVGGAAGVGSIIGTGIILGALAIPVTWPVVLAAACISAVTGRFAVKKFFGSGAGMGGGMTDKFTESLKGAVADQIRASAEESDLNQKVRDQINVAFESLKNKVNNETETVLKDMEGTLASLEKEIAQKEVLGEKETEDLQEMLQNVAQITERAMAINKKLAAILER